MTPDKQRTYIGQWTVKNNEHNKMLMQLIIKKHLLQSKKSSKYLSTWNPQIKIKLYVLAVAQWLVLQDVFPEL